jgi:cysteinyl-tRNA synthetase
MPAKQQSATAHLTLRVYNTLSRQKEPFATVRPGKVGIYLCGPTVYDKAHIGHMVGPVIFDCIKRYLTYCGYDVNWVVNITDVDDKLIKKANEQNKSMFEVAEDNIADYSSNLAALGVDQIDHFPRATECMPDIIHFVECLIQRGIAYESDGDVYFDVGKDAEYGKLSNRSIESMQGEGGAGGERKRHAADFALWKAAKPGEPSWESPWGAGRPGWHIECSAMSKKLLGETFDIHGGGLDLVFPHHENEIAQSECCHQKPMVSYWAHNGLLRAAKLSFTARVPAELQANLGKKIESVLAQPKWEMPNSKGKTITVDRKAGIDSLEFEKGTLHASINLRFEGELEAADVLRALGLGAIADAASQKGPAGKIGGRSDRQSVGVVALEDQGKMSRSKGAGGLADLIKRQGGERIRYFLLRTHYRSTVVFSEPAIEEAATGLESFYRLFKRYTRVTGKDSYSLKPAATRAADEAAGANGSSAAGNDAELKAAAACRVKFITAMDDDFNTGGAIAELFELAKITNKFCDDADLEGKGKNNQAAVAKFTALLTTLKELSNILGIFATAPAKPQAAGDDLVGKLMPLVIELRAAARKNKNFAVADKIRNGLAPTGITLEDRSGGTEWTGGSTSASDAIMQLLIQLRADARAAKDFVTGDAIRDGLTAIGITLEDRAGGTEWTKS